MVLTLSFYALLTTYRLKGRTLFALVEKGDAITLHFDLFHCDDPVRNRDGTEYRLDVTIKRENFRMHNDGEEPLRDNFSADVLDAEIVGDELRLVADGTFYGSKKQHIIEIVLIGNRVELCEYSPAPVKHT